MAAQRALLPIYRLRFNLLYQFGFIEVNPDEWVLYEKDTPAGHPDVSEASLLAKIPAFSTADEVILLDIELPEQSKAALQAASASIGIHYPQLSIEAQAAFDTLAAELSKPHSISEKSRLNIVQVRRLYPLTTQAGQLLASRLDPRIKRQPAVFEAVAEQADHRLLASETRLGSEALLEIAGVPSKHLDEGLLQDVEKAVAVRLERREIQTSDSFWVHLIVYGRYEPFPKNDYGYLYDLCVVFHRSLSARDGRRGHDNSYEATRFYKALEANRAASTRERVTQLLLNAEWAEKLRNELTDTRTNLRMYLSAFIYLKFRGEFEAEDYQFSGKLLDLIRLTADHYPSETRVALQLLGGFLTFNKISGAYYEVRQIPLFQERGQKYIPISEYKTSSQRRAELFAVPPTASILSGPSKKVVPDEEAPVFEWNLTAEQDARQRAQASQQMDAPTQEAASVGLEELQSGPNIVPLPEAPAIKPKRSYQKKGNTSAVPKAEKLVKVKESTKTKNRRGCLIPSLAS
ncbi:hypothetical protein [Hymenobacter sp. 102]|uniref:hypothetical protein n=1 Tax=Hymenobacter sp. 102 TaxID=3403152 RepID=UPI003CED4BE1